MSSLLCWGLMCFYPQVQKALLMAMLIATFVIPMRNAKNPRLSRPLKRTVRQLFIFTMLWVLCLKYLYWHLPK